jgi:energy-coupling factor transporter transmembrane protein EcfT
MFVLTLGMCYRYIFLFLETIENTYMAIKSRVGGSLHYKKGQHLVSSSIAGLWQRSYQLNKEVYSAMLSRGYRGEPRQLEEFKARFSDWACVGGALAILCMAVYVTYIKR